MNVREMNAMLLCSMHLIIFLESFEERV